MKNVLRNCRGSALATVVLITTVIGVTAAVLLSYSLSEFRLNQRSILRFQAKDAAEAMLEYGSAELMARLKNDITFSSSELSGNPLTTQTTRKATLFAQGVGISNNVAPASLRFWASQFTEAGLKYVDPGDPGNEFDPLRGLNIRTQVIRFLAQSTATAGDVVAPSYASEAIEIRDAFLFNYAIFYNVTMEFHPGADMTIAGPVHSNVDSYITASNSLNFMDSVTTAGSFSAVPKSNAGSGRPTGRDINFFDGTTATHTVSWDNANNPTADKIKGYDGSVLGTYVDSTLASRSSGNSFAATASQTWRGNVQDSAMGVIVQNLPAVPSGTDATAIAKAHDLIEPKDTSVTTASPADVQSRENQKFSNKAGLYIIQGAPGTDGAAGGTPPAPVAFKSSADAAAYKASANRVAWRAANPTKIVQLPTDMVKNNRRMYDHREGKTVNTVDVDMGKLRTAVNSTTAAAATNLKVWDSGSSTYTADWDLDATSGGWNGQVYVEVESPTAGYTATSDVGTMGSGAGTATSVRLVNGTQLPNRKAANASAPEGVTVATNAPIYVVGNYNSPGLNAGTRGGTAVGTENVSTIGDPKDGEVPAAIVADAINVLSKAWWDAGTGKPTGDSNSAAGTGSRIAANTEISAAFLTGNVATAGTGTSNNNYSGGVENFPRLHESWSQSGNRTLRYRGSMVALFNSEIATGRWADASYGAPTREWGFNQMFASSSGRQPPGTPMVRTFRRLDYRDLSKTDFDALLATTSYAFTEM